MLSDDELLNHDASDNLFIRETPREDSPRTLTRHLINRFGLSSKGGTETVTNNTQSVNYAPIFMHSSHNYSQAHCQNNPGALKMILYCKA